MQTPPPQPQPPQGQPGQQQGSPVEAIVSQIHDGLMQLMQIFQHAQLPPQDMQHLGGIITSFQALIEELSNPQGQQKTQPPQPRGPMAENAGPGSKPV